MIQAAILAGGLGTRLRSVIADRPKVLAPVGGRPYLAHLLDELVAARVTTCVLCTGHLGEQIEAVFGPSYAGMPLRYSRETAPLGTAGALRLALPHVTAGEDVLVLNGDSFCQVDVRRLAQVHAQSGALASMVVVEVPDTSRYGRVVIGPDDRVMRFDEKQAGAGRGWVNAGMYMLTPRVLRSIPGGVVSLERDVFPQLVSAGIAAFKSAGPFLDIGTPESYAAAERFFAARMHAHAGRDS